VSPTAHLLLRFVLLLAAGLTLASGSAGARGDESRPLTAIFYYVWYESAERDGSYGTWGREGHSPPFDIASSYYPQRGPYSSADPRVLRAQMAEIAGAGIDQLIVSWWGWGSPEDLRLPAVLDFARRFDLDVAIHLEPYPGRTAATIEADVAHLRTLGIRDFYVYAPTDVRADVWAELNDRLGGDVRVFAQTALVGYAAAAHFDAVYTYDVLAYDGDSFRRFCNQARVARLVCAPSVGPGFDARRLRGDSPTKPRRRGATYDAMWQGALDADADMITITSYNEWHEGTQIEPALSAPQISGFSYLTYSGAWGMRGSRAARAYLVRTARWTKAFAAVRAAEEP
jgi:hypothetical protein